MELKNFIALVPDFPKQGIIFRDMSPLLADPKAFKETIRQMKAAWEGEGITKIGAFDARGFIFASALALEMGLPFFMLRKKGKLPGDTLSLSYGLEYGSDVIEMQKNAVSNTDLVLLVDDVLATGGTARAGRELIEACGANVAGLATVMELGFLEGRKVFGSDVHALITYGDE